MNPFLSFVRAIRDGRPPVRRTVRLNPEPLEDRAVPSAVEWRSQDGTGNNLAHPDWGTAGSAFLRVAPAEYGDGVSSPAGASRPSAREISNTLANQGGDEVLSDRMLSAMVYAWGQFIDHDIDLTPSESGESFPISVPAGDPYFDPLNTGTQTIPLTRSSFISGTGTDGLPRQQANAITAWLDGSMVYGSDTETAASLRTFEGGHMKTSAGNLLPTDNDGNFLAGDIRVNENPELTSMQTLFVREHNRIADRVAQENPGLSDEQVYQRARAWVIAEIQAITYNEWLPTLLGHGAIDPYRGYDSAVNPGISNEFATAGFRFGHSLLGDDIEFLGNDGRPVAEEVSLAAAFFNPSLVATNGIDPILKYLASDPSSEVDTMVVDSVRNFLFGPPGSGGLDLASLNIQRGRDHGLADYNTVRAAFGLPRVSDFTQITSDPTVQSRLQALYGSVEDIDLWVGALAEDHVAGGSVGPTLRAIISDQFERLRDGDRFWYQREFSAADRRELEQTTLASVIARNTELTTVQRNAFIFRAEVRGRVFDDANRNGKSERGERGLAGRSVELVDVDTGEVVASGKTGPNGVYLFDVLDGVRTGRYEVRAVLTEGETPTTPTGRYVSIQGGDTYFAHTDLGIASANPQPQPQTDSKHQPPPAAPSKHQTPSAAPSKHQPPLHHQPPRPQSTEPVQRMAADFGPVNLPFHNEAPPTGTPSGPRR